MNYNAFSAIETSMDCGIYYLNEEKMTDEWREKFRTAEDVFPIYMRMLRCVFFYITVHMF